MATNFVISPELLERAATLGGKSKTGRDPGAAEFIARPEQHRLLELFDPLDWNPTFNYKTERSRG